MSDPNNSDNNPKAAKPPRLQEQLPASRRTFLKRLLFGGAGLSATWLVLRETGLGKVLNSLIAREHHVDNQPPLSPVVVKNFSKTPSVRCLVVGDWGTGDAFQRRVAASMAAVADREHPQCILSTGDNFYPSGVESTSDSQFRTKWKNVYSAASLQVPWYLSLGNHDYRKSADAQIAYTKIDAMWQMPARYYNVERNDGGVQWELFVLDTDSLMHGSKEEDAKQLGWLEAALQKSTAKWKVVMGHHMVRSHGAYGDQSFMVQKVKPLLDRYGVQVYLNGHDHDLQYLKAPEDHFVCLISGAGGGSRNTSYGKNTRFAATNGGFVYLAFTETTLHLEFYDANGNAMFADDVVGR